MKRVLFIAVILFVFVAMVSCAGKWYRGEKVLRARGVVESYEPGKTINLKPGTSEQLLTMEGTNYVRVPENAPPVEYVYAITPDTEVKGEIKKGVRVLIRYTQIGTGVEAAKTAVSVDAY
jgi:hypothetical protein